METNIAEIVKALNEQKSLFPIAGYYEFWIQLIPAVGALIFAFVGWLNSKTASLNSKTAASDAKIAANAAEETKKLAVETTTAVGKIEVEVNSKATAMIAKVADLQREVAQLREQESFAQGIKEEKFQAADKAAEKV